jgi:VanZ family protein
LSGVANTGLTVRPALARGLLAAALFAVLVATLTPMGGEKPHVSLCLVCGERWASDILLNVILYLPLGVALALGGWRGLRALLGPGLLSASIEVAQFWIPGRDPSLGDVTFDTLGAALGLLLVQSSSLWLRPRGRLKPGLAVFAAASAVAVLGATGVLLRPDLPRSAYWGQWTPDLGNLARYGGRVLSASLGPRDLPHGRLQGSEQVRELLLARSPLEVRAVAGPRVSALASLVSIADDQSREIVLLGPDRGDIVFRYRALAATLGFDEPDVRAAGAMRGVGVGDSLSVGVQPDGKGYCLVVNDRAACGLGLTVGRGWALLYYPESFPSWLRTLLDDAWVAGLMIPLGFWIRGRGFAAALVVAVAVAAWGVTPATGLLPATSAEVAGAVLGFGLGRALQRLAAASGASP